MAKRPVPLGTMTNILYHFKQGNPMLLHAYILSKDISTEQKYILICRTLERAMDTKHLYGLILVVPFAMADLGRYSHIVAPLLVECLLLQTNKDEVDD